MARRHLTFRNFHTTTLRATEELFTAGPWRGDDEERATKFETWLRRASDAYGIPAPTLEIVDDPAIEANGGVYDLGQITLAKFSVILLFHQFRHHMQALGAAQVETTGFPNIDLMTQEQDAISWACSLFYKTRPIMFRKLVRNGSIRYVSPGDLLARQRDDSGAPLSDSLAGDYDDGEQVDDTDSVSAADVRLSTTEVMAALGRSRSWVCNHAEELGGEQDERGRWTFPQGAITA